jgi:hypothetical protein
VTAQNIAQKPAGNGCPRGCLDPDGEDCKASLISPCPQGRYQEDASGQFNYACGHLRSSTCSGCGVCTACDGCYCGEDGEHQTLIAETSTGDEWEGPVNEFDY